MVALQSNKLDYVLTAYTTALNFARVNKELEILQEKLLLDTCAIAVAKDNTELLEQIAGVLRQFEQDGTLDAIVSNWIKEDGSAYTITKTPSHDNSTKYWYYLGYGLQFTFRYFQYFLEQSWGR